MQITKQFVVAGNAKFTISNPNGMKFAYQIKHTRLGEPAHHQNTLLVYTFGANGKRLYVGRVNIHTGMVIVGRRSKVTETSLMFQVIKWACNVLWSGREFPADYQAETVGHCGRCGRKLANPRQLFGPECLSEYAPYQVTTPRSSRMTNDEHSRPRRPDSEMPPRATLCHTLTS